MLFFDENINGYQVKLRPGPNGQNYLEIDNKEIKHKITLCLDEGKLAKLKMSVSDLLDFQRKPAHELYQE